MKLTLHAHPKYFGVIGDPIAHSLSPMIHHALYAHYGLDALYLPFHIAKGDLDQLASLTHMLPLSGFNVTMPHKQDIMVHLDEVDPTAQLHQSVNTVCIREGRWVGFSTDAPGFSLSLAQRHRTFQGSNVVFLGSGGVANTLALQAASDGARSICLLARSLDKAASLADRVQRLTGQSCCALAWTPDALAQQAQTADLLINTTPLGMAGYAQDFEDLGFLEALPTQALVCDLIYAPMQTRFLQEAHRLGLETSNGLDMLIGQAFVAFQHFLGILPGASERDLVLQTLQAEGLLTSASGCKS